MPAIRLIGLFSLTVAGLTTMAAAAAPDDPAAIPPTANREPGPEYADGVRMFQGIASLAGSSGGRLWATWYGGGVTEDQHNYIMLVTSGDDGRTWSGLKLVLDPDRDGPDRAFDPCPWLDPTGRLWLFWAQRGASGIPYLMAMTTDQPDEENPVWTRPRLICDGIMMDKPTVTADGTWLLPTAIWHRDESCRVVASNDQGKTFRLIGAAGVPNPKDRNCDEPIIVQRNDGSLWMWIRTSYGIGESTSTDGGKTWTPAVPSSVKHTTSRFFLRRLASGNLLLVKHGRIDERAGRSDLTAYVSRDDGQTWEGGLMLDQRPGVSYPDGFQNKQGTIYIIHDFDRRGDKQILMSAFCEEDALAGKDVSGKVRLGVLINRATGVNPGHKAPKAITVPKDQLRQHADGAKPLDGPAALVRVPGPSLGTFNNGAPLFTDRNYKAANVPETLAGGRYLLASINGATVEVAEEGVVRVITPLPDRNRDSVSEQLVKQGFEKVAAPEFHLFGTAANIVTTYQKRVKAGQRIAVGKWGILIFWVVRGLGD